MFDGLSEAPGRVVALLQRQTLILAEGSAAREPVAKRLFAALLQWVNDLAARLYVAIDTVRFGDEQPPGETEEAEAHEDADPTNDDDEAEATD